MAKSSASLFYQIYGNGTPVIFLHGFLLDHRLWNSLIPLLKDEMLMILPDLRGHGKSFSPEGEYKMEEMAWDVLNIMDDLGIDKAILVGHSMGGYVSLAFSHLFPSRLAGLGLVASHAAVDPPERRQVRKKSARDLPESGIEPMARDMAMQLSKKAEVRSLLLEMTLAANINGAAGSLYAMAGRGSALQWLKDIDVPIVLICGKDDAFVPLERMQEILAVKPRARLVEISGVGHVPMLEAPQRVAEALLWLIAEVSANQQG